MWSDEFPDPVIPNFEKATGIKVNQTPFSQNEEQINKLQATGGEGFDICQPTCNRAPQYKDLQVLAPWDTNKLKNMSALVPSMIANSKGLWTWEDGLHHLPHCWGSEAISFRTDLYKGDLTKLSYGSLWDDEVKGHTQGRGHSFLLGIGLWWDHTGKQPSNRMVDGYKDEASFKKLWDPILAFAIEHKSWVKQFWDSADNTKSGLMENDVWIGQTWDGPPLTLKKEGKPVSYQAPSRRRHRVARRCVADEVGEEHRAGLRVRQLPAYAGGVGPGVRRVELQSGGDRSGCADLGGLQEELPGSLSRRCAEIACGRGRRSRAGMRRSAANTSISSPLPDQNNGRTDDQPRFAGADFILGWLDPA